jgi:hypothetical protein
MCAHRAVLHSCTVMHRAPRWYYAITHFAATPCQPGRGDTAPARLAAKADEEDSDAEDTELPLTHEEAATQQAQVAAWADECDKVRVGGCVRRPGCGSHAWKATLAPDARPCLLPVLPLPLEQVHEQHQAALASRASALLRASALAEWRRSACPPLFSG